MVQLVAEEKGKRKRGIDGEFRRRLVEGSDAAAGVFPEHLLISVSKDPSMIAIDDRMHR